MGKTFNFYIIPCIITVILLISLMLLQYTKRTTSMSYSNYLNKYGKFNKIAFGLFFLYVSVMVTVWYFILKYIELNAHNFLSQHFYNSIFIATINTDLYFLIAVFLGMITASFPLYLTLKIILKDDYLNYLTSSDPDGFLLKINNILFVGVLLLASFLMIFGLNFYIVFEDDSFTNNSFLSLREEKYYYENIGEIYYSNRVYYDDGKEINTRDYYFVLNDGTIFEISKSAITTVDFEENILDMITSKYNLVLMDSETNNK